MANPDEKYKRLNQEVNADAEINFDTGYDYKQLIYPTDLASNIDHSGLVFVFNFAKLKGSKEKEYENWLLSPDNQFKTYTNFGVENTEVAMQRDAGASSLRTNNGKGLESIGLKTTGGYQLTDLITILPPCQQWQDGLNANWQTVEMGILGRLGDLQHTNATQTKTDLIMAYAGRMAAAGVEKGTGGGAPIKSFVELVTGTKQNSYAEVLFGGVTNRTFAFQWNLIPRNKAEADVIRAIIHRFRYAMLPELVDEADVNGSFYKAPWLIDVHIVDVRTGKESKYFPRIGTLAITNVTANRTPQGEMALLSDDEDSHIPAAITLEIQATEMFVLDKSNLSALDVSY